MIILVWLHMSVVIALMVRAFVLGMDLKKHIVTNHPDKAAEFGLPGSPWWGEPMRLNWRMHQLLKNDNIGDAELLRLGKRAKKACIAATVGFFLAPVTVLFVLLIKGAPPSQ